MSEQRAVQPAVEEIPAAVAQERSRFSIVWLIPLVAAVIGAWIAYKGLSEQGPKITITFKTAEGLEAEKTKIKFKDVEVGFVEAIDLSEDLSGVVVTAELNKGAEPYLTEGTRFWVVRARVAAGQVSGLGTLFSGAYIAIDPVKEGKSARVFKGLEKPPIVTMGEPGRHFVLRAETRGSVDVGSPVYYRQIKVGQVVGYELEEHGQGVSVKIFIHAPHHERVRKDTRFWNTSGLDVAVDASGIKVNTESVVSLLLGGISFDTLPNLERSAPAEEGDEFQLHENRQAAQERTYGEKVYRLLYFAGSVRGLTVGAPVEFRGIKIGQVVDIKLEFHADEFALRIPVLIEMEPERIALVGGQPRPVGEKEDEDEVLQRLVRQGLRAQLKTGSLLTGQLYVDLDFHPEAPPAQITRKDGYIVLPTVPATMEEITARLTQLLDKLEKLPIEEIANHLRGVAQGAERLVNSRELLQTIQALNETLKQTKALVTNLDSNTTPEVTATLEQAQKTLASADRLLDENSTLRLESKRLLKELSRAARSIRVMADYLEQHPEALLRGKGARP